MPDPTDAPVTETVAPATTGDAITTTAAEMAIDAAPPADNPPEPGVDADPAAAITDAAVDEPGVDSIPEPDLDDQTIAQFAHDVRRRYAEVCGDTAINLWGFTEQAEQQALIDLVASCRENGPPHERLGTRADMLQLAAIAIMLGKIGAE